MAASSLLCRQIDDMTKQPTQRGTKRMENSKLFHALEPPLPDHDGIAGA